MNNRNLHCVEVHVAKRHRKQFRVPGLALPLFVMIYIRADQNYCILSLKHVGFRRTSKISVCTLHFCTKPDKILPSHLLPANTYVLKPIIFHHSIIHII